MDSPEVFLQFAGDRRIVSQQLELPRTDLTAEIRRARFRFQMIDLGFEPASLEQFQRIRRALPPHAQKLVDREDPHLGLRGQKHEVIDWRAVILDLGSEGVGFELNEEIIDNGDIGGLHGKVRIVTKKRQCPERCPEFCRLIARRHLRFVVFRKIIVAHRTNPHHVHLRILVASPCWRKALKNYPFAFAIRYSCERFAGTRFPFSRQTITAMP